MTDIYVYYRIDPQRRTEARAGVDALLGRVQAATGVRGTLSERADDPTTWMESYLTVADPVRLEAALEAALDESPLAGLVGERHVERFVRCA